MSDSYTYDNFKYNHQDDYAKSILYIAFLIIYLKGNIDAKSEEGKKKLIDDIIKIRDNLGQSPGQPPVQSQQLINEQKKEMLKYSPIKIVPINHTFDYPKIKNYIEEKLYEATRIAFFRERGDIKENELYIIIDNAVTEMIKKYNESLGKNNDTSIYTSPKTISEHLLFNEPKLKELMDEDGEDTFYSYISKKIDIGFKSIIDANEPNKIFKENQENILTILKNLYPNIDIKENIEKYKSSDNKSDLAINDSEIINKYRSIEYEHNQEKKKRDEAEDEKKTKEEEERRRRMSYHHLYNNPYHPPPPAAPPAAAPPAAAPPAAVLSAPGAVAPGAVAPGSVAPGSVVLSAQSQGQGQGRAQSPPPPPPQSQSPPPAGRRAPPPRQRRQLKLPRQRRQLKLLPRARAK